MTPHDPEHWRELGARLRLQGRLVEAVAACRRALEHAPTDARAWSELAHALRWQGNLDEAREAAIRAVEAAPELADAWFNLGAVLVEQSEVARGVEAYRKALELEPDFAEAWSNLGGALGAQGRTAEEIDAYRRALEVNPQLAPVWSNLGHALRASGEVKGAVEACLRAVELDRGSAAAWSNLGNALRELGDPIQSQHAFEQALELDPEFAAAWSNLGSLMLEQNKPEQALAAYRRALELQTQDARLHYNLGVALRRDQQHEAAVENYRRALELDPGLTEAWINLSLALRELGQLEGSVAAGRRAVEISPDNPEAHGKLAHALLMQGDLEEGWVEYEWRWRESGVRPRRFDFALWRGERLERRRLLLWGEQGIGDEIMYSSMLADLAAAGMQLTLEMDSRLVSLMRRSFPGVTVVPRTEPPTPDPATFDCQSPLASLGHWLRPSFDAFPRHAGYLKADAERVEVFSARLRPSGSERVVGISWISANPELGPHKSSTLSDWAGMLSAPGTRFVDLQYGDTGEARGKLREDCRLEITHLDDVDLFNDLEGLAALCAACDLVITVSNVTAHMGGALGKPVWLLAPKAKGKLWYWFAGRPDSPWYPSMRIFTQQTPGSWREVLDSVAHELAAFVKS